MVTVNFQLIEMRRMAPFKLLFYAIILRLARSEETGSAGLIPQLSLRPLCGLVFSPDCSSSRPCIYKTGRKKGGKQIAKGPESHFFLNFLYFRIVDL